MILYTMGAERTVDVLDREIQEFENKGTLVPISWIRRIFMYLWKRLHKELVNDSTSIMLQIIPKKKISLLDFENIIDSAFDRLNKDKEKIDLIDEKNKKKVYFKNFITFIPAKDEFIEDEYLDEGVFSDFDEPVAELVSIELVPENQQVLSLNPEQIFLIVLNFFHRLQLEITKELPNETKHILTLYYEEGNLQKLKKLKEILIKETNLKVYVRDDNGKDKLGIIIPADLINHPDIRQKLSKILK